MRKQTLIFVTQIDNLKTEFLSLRKEIFGESAFVIVDENNPKMLRYNQLLGFFYPYYRTKGWISPYQESDKL
jgi:hypothetical protein